MNPPTKLLFGTKITILTRDDESSTTVTEKVSHANIVQHYMRIRESVKITDDAQVLREFLGLLDACKDNKVHYDPAFEMISDQRTGKIVQVYKSWSEPQPLSSNP
jgi:hypothetical protein